VVGSWEASYGCLSSGFKGAAEKVTGGPQEHGPRLRSVTCTTFTKVGGERLDIIKYTVISLHYYFVLCDLTI